MKTFDRWAFAALFLATVVSGTLGASYFVLQNPVWSKFVSSAGLLATAAGVVQLEVSGFFDRFMEQLNDNSDRYPLGPPSNVVRHIIDNPDEPVRTWLRNMLFFRVRTGFWLIVGGTLVQVWAVWM